MDHRATRYPSRSALFKLILTSLIYYAFWVLFFAVSRMIFIAYHFDFAAHIPSVTMVATLWQGLPLDLSMSGYISILPMLICTLLAPFTNKNLAVIIKCYSVIFVATLSVLLVADIGLYQHTSTRIDGTFLNYINTPTEMVASATWSQIIFGVLFSIANTILWTRALVRVTDTYSVIEAGRWWHVIPMLILTGLLIVPMRGGLQTIPINQSSAYFSEHQFANHAAVNYAWSFMKSVSKGTHKMKNPFIRFDKALAQNILDVSLINADSLGSRMLTTTRPNIILIVWESFTAKVVGPLGGDEAITPKFNNLTKEGIFFERFYANGPRSDKGLAAITSGYYPQPDQSIMKHPNKSRNLPMLPKSLRDSGYTTSFYYGGNMNFGNMNTYFRNGINHIVSGDQFDRADWNSKWGAHDHVVFQRLKDDLVQDSSGPFFDMIFTLSSHEPFEINGEYRFGRDNEEQRFKSAMSYTDETISDFVSWSKKQSWWDHTLIIITADHGHPLPKEEGPFNGPRRFHIPMLWTGGAVAQDTTISSISSQVDLPYTLLRQLDIPAEDFIWSQDIFARNEKYASWVFPKGYGIIDDHSELVYDYNGQQVIHQKGDQSSKLDSLGQSIVQTVYEDFLHR